MTEYARNPKWERQEAKKQVASGKPENARKNASFCLRLAKCGATNGGDVKDGNTQRAANYTGVSYNDLLKAMDSGEVAYIVSGGKRLVKVADVLKYMERHGKMPAAMPYSHFLEKMRRHAEETRRRHDLFFNLDE